MISMTKLRMVPILSWALQAVNATIPAFPPMRIVAGNSQHTGIATHNSFVATISLDTKLR